MKKNWYNSKTIWSGVAIAVIGVFAAFGVDLGPFKEAIIAIASGLGLIGIRDALN